MYEPRGNPSRRTGYSRIARVRASAATADANGEYRLDSYGFEDGAPAGEFKVAVVWPEPPPPNFDGIYEAKDRLRGRYASPQKSNLTARVEPGGGEIPPFELQ